MENNLTNVIKWDKFYLYARWNRAAFSVSGGTEYQAEQQQTQFPFLQGPLAHAPDLGHLLQGLQ